MIRFWCECGRQLQARESDVGRLAACPMCGKTTTVPEGGPDREPPRAAEAIQERSPSRGRDRDDTTREPYDYDDEPPRRRRPVEQAPNGLATASLVFGILAFPCMFGLLASLPAILLGILGLRKAAQGKGTVGGKGSAIAGLVLGSLGLLMIPALVFAYLRVAETGRRQADSTNLKHLSLAMHNYNDTYGSLPAATAFRTKDGKPGLSWRVALLPFIEQDNLFKQFKLDEPWDSPHNIRLLGSMPRTYLVPGQTPDSRGLTHYQVFVGPGTVFEPRQGQPLALPQFPGAPEKGRNFSEILDGASNTILIATARDPVPWTKPDDLVYDQTRPLPPLGAPYSSRGFSVGLADGSIRFIPYQVPERTLRLLIERNDGHSIPPLP